MSDLVECMYKSECLDRSIYLTDAVCVSVPACLSVCVYVCVCGRWLAGWLSVAVCVVGWLVGNRNVLDGMCVRE
jgi:hypothetical protein